MPQSQSNMKPKQTDLMASSSALNKFMRSIIKSDEEKDEQTSDLFLKKECT